MVLHLLSRVGDEAALSVIRAGTPAVVVALAGPVPPLPPGFTALRVSESDTTAGEVSWAELARKVFEADRVYAW